MADLQLVHKVLSRELVFFTNVVLFLSVINCTLLKERLKSGQNCAENKTLRTLEGLISSTRICVLIFERNRPIFISKCAPVSQAEAKRIGHFRIKGCFYISVPGNHWCSEV